MGAKRILFLLMMLFNAMSESAFSAADDSAYPSIELTLSSDEKAWIKSHPQVYFTGDPNWLPYEAFKKDGSYIGIVADHLDLIERYTGIEFIPIAVRSWSEALNIAMQGRVDVISGDAADATLEQQFNAVQPYIHNPIVIIMVEDQNYVEDLNQIKDKKIAIIRDYGYTSDIRTHFPHIDFIEVENIQQGLNGVAEKRFDALLATMALASYHMAKMGLRNVKVVGKTPIIMDLTLFVDKREPVLHAIVEKALNALPLNSTQNILQNWVTRKYVEKTDYRLFFQILTGFLLLFSFTWWWILRLRLEVNHRREVEVMLRKSEERYDLAMAVANDGIWDWDIANDKVIFDRRYYTMAGYQAYAFPQSFLAWESRVHPEDIEAVKNELQRYLEGESQKYDVEFRFRRKLGDYMWIQARGKIVEFDENEKPIRILGTHSDISQQKAYEKQLEHIAHFDSLTNLPNRVLLIDRLNQAMYQAQRRNLKLAVAYLDLDGFKAINDENDHLIGDQFLAKISYQMHEVLRKGDTIARLGGDEFVAVLVDLPSSDESLSLIKRLLNAAAMPVAIENQILRVSASIGVTFFPQKIKVDAEQLIRQADHSMYKAKMNGKNRYQLFDLDLDDSEESSQDNVDAAIEAFNKNQFMMHYQPMVNMHTGEVLGFEALMRWQHPRRGILLPLHFISLIENTDAEIMVGEWAIETVLQQLSEWVVQGKSPPVNINISAKFLQRADFTDTMTALLEKYPEVSPASVVLEVSEIYVLKNINMASTIIDECNNLGVKFTLDHFGSESAILSYLKQIPATTVKIDQRFVRNMLEKAEDLAILEGITGFASGFNRQVIAEGVESVEQGVMLLKMGCQLGQGYQIARPMPAENVLPWINKWKPCQVWQLQKAYNREDYTVLFATVEHRAWVRDVERFLFWENTKFPEIDHDACLFGKWLLNEGKTRYGKRPIFISLQRVHEEIHDLAKQLLKLHYKGNHSDAKAGLEKIYTLRDRLLDYVNILVLE
jgi:diguanylate cyclase (GGDEF)-like protein/PAS domain S-box-containing protein